MDSMPIHGKPHQKSSAPEWPWGLIPWLLLVASTCTNASESMFAPAVNDPCRPDCNCSHNAMTCDGFIPFAIPDPVRELILTRLNSNELQPRRFCHLDRSWHSLTTLKFISAGSYSLLNCVFDCLSDVTSFQFQSEVFSHFDNFTFTGLSNVTSLDLSGCQSLNWEDLYRTLSISQNFPKLDHLILSGTGNFGQMIINLDDTFVNILSTRHISYLDLSYLNFQFNFKNSESMCKTLKYLSYAGSRVQFTPLFRKGNVCGSLRILDGSYTMRILFDRHCVNEHSIIFMPRFFEAVETIFFNGMVTHSSKFMPSNCTISLFDYSNVTTFQFSQNYLPNFDIMFINNRIKLLNLSKNSVEYINSKAFEGLSSLNELDLSGNTLSKLSDFDKGFSELFHFSSQLMYVHLNGNGLQYIPKGTFVSNLYLERLDLSNNSLTQVNFEISHLLDLKQLNLRLNKIEALDDASRQTLDDLYANQMKANKTDSVNVQLHDNPLLCECRCLTFLQWLVKAPIFSTTRNDYKCQLDGHYILLESDGINAAKEDCERARRKRLKTILLSTLLSLGALIILVVSFLLYKRYKKNSLRRQFADGIRRLRENADRFPVFLSYSSDDNDFVRRHVLQPMQDHLKLITGLDRELVCNADLHFHPARTILSEIFRWVKQCEVFVAVMSENYCKSRFCRYEIEHAHLLEKPIILLFIEHVPKEDMNLITREVFETFTRVQFVFEDGLPILKPGWKQMCESVIQLICKVQPRNDQAEEAEAIL